MSITFGPSSFADAKEVTPLVPEPEPERKAHHIHAKVIGSNGVIHRVLGKSMGLKDLGDLEIYDCTLVKHDVIPSQKAAKLIDKTQALSVVKALQSLSSEDHTLVTKVLDGISDDVLFAYLLGKGFDFSSRLPSPVITSHSKSFK